MKERNEHPPYVEYRGVLAVMNAVLRHPSQNMEPLIAFNDKNMSFDGTIEVYNSKNWNKETHEGTVRLQVKSTSVKPIVDGKITHPVDKKDLNMYKKEHGVLFFVVIIDGIAKEKVYYNALTTMDIQQILQRMGKQQTIKIDFWPLDDTRLETICRESLRHKKYQPEILVNDTSLFATPLNINMVEVSSLTFDEKSTSANNMFQHQFQFYGTTEMGSTVPLTSARIKELTTQEKFIFKSANTKSVDLPAEVIISEQESTLVIGNIFSMTFRNTKRKNFSYKFISFKSLHDQLQTLPLIIDFFSGHSLWINGKEFQSIVSENAVVKEFEELKEQLHNCLKIAEEAKECFIQMNIPLNTLIYDNDVQKIYRSLQMMIDIIINKNYDLMDKSLDKSIDRNKKGHIYTRLKVGEQFIGVIDSVGSVPRVENAFSENRIKDGYEIWNEDNQQTPLSVFGPLGIESMVGCLNIHHSDFRKSIDYSNPFNNELSTDLNLKLALNCIDMYDQTQDKEWLQNALYIYAKHPNYNLKSKLIDDIDKANDTSTNLNILQIRYRLDQLSKEDKNYLMEVKTVSIHDHPDVHFAVAALLGNVDDMNFAITKMKKEIWDMLKEYPIYEVYKQINNQDQNFSELK